MSIPILKFQCMILWIFVIHGSNLKMIVVADTKTPSPPSPTCSCSSRKTSNTSRARPTCTTRSQRYHIVHSPSPHLLSFLGASLIRFIYLCCSPCCSRNVSIFFPFFFIRVLHYTYIVPMIHYPTCVYTPP